MNLYWYIFCFISFFSISPINLEQNFQKLLKILFLFLLAIFIGLRNEVGGDWDIYLYDFNNNSKIFDLQTFKDLNIKTAGSSWIEKIQFFQTYYRDLGYELLQSIIYYLNLKIYGLNFLLSIIFVLSINKFCKSFDNNNYWLIFVIAFPYLITVVAMGFTRQATALSFVLIALTYFKNNKLIPFFLYTAIAILFHKSSAIILPFILLSNFKINIKYFLTFLSLAIIALILIIPEYSRIETGYLVPNSIYVSKGVVYRISLNLLAGLLFIIFFSKLKFDKKMNTLIISVFIFNILLLIFIKNYSTLIDRLIIYFIFIQLIIYSRLYLVMPKFKMLFNISIIILYAIVYYVWFNFSIHSYAWLPYQNILLKYF